jgi:anaerobic selenocysteine-containing dehydrogenase
MKLFKTMCARDCPDACWLDVTVENDTITKVIASTENPFTNGITCPRAAVDPKRTYSDKRVLHPYIRKPSPETGYNKVEWDQAVQIVVDRLGATIEKHGRESVLLLDYTGNTGYITNGYSKRLWNALGVTMTDYAVCSESGHAGINLHYGLSYGCQPKDLKKMQTIVFWGFNAKTSSPHQWGLATQARKENNTQIIVVDPRESETAELSNLWVCPKPGSDVALAYGVSNNLITNDLIDHDFIKQYTHGFEEYKQEALKWNQKRVQKITGVERNVLEEFYRLLLRKPNVFMIGLGLNKSLTGAESCRAVSLLPALLGQHRGFYYTNSRGRIITGDVSGSSLTKQHPKVVSMISLGQRLAAGEFKYVYVFGMNPTLTLPDSNEVIEGFKRKDCFVVVHDTHHTETTHLADIVLPATTYLEKDDLIISDCHSFVRLARKTIQPIKDSINEFTLMKEIARRLQVEEPWVYTDPWSDMEEVFRDAFIDGDIEDLINGKPLQLRHKPMNEYQTATHKIEFNASIVAEGISSLPQQIKIHLQDDEVIMLNSALPQYTHTQFRDIYDKIPCVAWVNPEDAEKNNLKDTEKYTLYNRCGQLIVTIRVTNKSQPGVIWCPRELLDDQGNPQNSLTPGTPQKIGGGPIFNSVKVRFRQ